MNSEELLSRLRELSEENLRIAKAKNEDYAPYGDAFANFRACEVLNIQVETGFLTRMTDKLIRVSNLLDRPASVRDESVLDTLSDLANYAMLLRVWLEQKGR